MIKHARKVVPIAKFRSVSEEIAELAFQFWLSRCFREGGSPEDALFHAILALEFGVAAEKSAVPKPIERALCRVISIDRKPIQSETRRNQAIKQRRLWRRFLRSKSKRRSLKR